MRDENNIYKDISLKEFIFEKYIRKIFSVFFISNNINIDDINVNEISKRQNFINNLSLFEWFDLYGKYTLKAINKKILKIIIQLFILFIVINIALFTTVIINELKDKQYPKQKAILIASHTITRIYILPIGKHLGFQTPILIPFRFVRDCLYNKGISMLPKNSPEREVWWYNTRFLEYASVLEPTLFKWFVHREKPFSKQEIEEINSWNNEVYKHILLFYSIDFSNTIYKANHLNIYKDLIKSYIRSSALFSEQQQLMTPFWQSELQKTNRKKIPGPKYEAVKHNIELIKSFDELKLKIKKENQNAYDKYMQEPIVEEYIFKKNIIEYYLNYKETFEKIDCNSNEFLMYTDLTFKIINYIIQNGNNSDPRDVFAYQVGLMSSVDHSVCPSFEERLSQEHEKLLEYFKKRQEEFNKKQQKNK